MTADDEIRTTRFAEIGSVLTARVEDTQALLTKGQKLGAEVRQAIDEDRLDEARQLIDEASSIPATAAAEMTEVHRLTKMTGEEFEAAADSAADPVARDESLRSRLWGHADRGDAGIRWLLEELTKKYPWWQRRDD